MWNAADVPSIFIQAAFHTSADEAEILFALEDGIFSGDKRIPVPITPDGGVHTVHVDLHSHPLYSGVITKLRFDPIVSSTPGAIVDFHSLSVVSPSSAPDAPPSTGSIPAVIIEKCRPNPFEPVVVDGETVAMTELFCSHTDGDGGCRVTPWHLSCFRDGGSAMRDHFKRDGDAARRGDRRRSRRGWPILDWAAAGGEPMGL